MIENKNDASRNLEKALHALEQAKQRVANEKKKQNEKRRKAENHHKYIMGGIIVKYFSDCYRYDEEELNRILSVALQIRECQQIISKIKSESRGNISTLFTGCAQIYHQRWYVRPSGSKFHLHGLLRRALSVLRQPKGEMTILLRKLRLLPYWQNIGVAYG